MGRREALGWFLTGGLAVAATQLVDVASVSSEGHRTDFSSPSADYTLLYGRHSGSSRLSPALLPAHYDALVVENIYPYLDQPEWTWTELIRAGGDFAGDLLLEAYKRQTDIVFADLPTGYIQSMGASALDAAGGPAVGLGGLIHRYLADQPVLAGNVAILLGVLSVTKSLVRNVSNITDNLDGVHSGIISDISITVSGAADLISPLDAGVTLRNLSLASKTPALEREYNAAGISRPHFVLAMGSGHRGLPVFCGLNPDHRKNYLAGLAHTLRPTGLLTQPEALYTSLIMEGNNNLHQRKVVDVQLQQLLS